MQPSLTTLGTRVKDDGSSVQEPDQLEVLSKKTNLLAPGRAAELEAAPGSTPKRGARTLPWHVWPAWRCARKG